MIVPHARSIALALCLAVASHAATAQTAPPLTTLPSPMGGERMSDVELQGLSCMMVGSAAAVGALGYSGAIAAASVIDVTFPFLILPALAGGYAIGCSVGSNTGPGAYWLYRWFTRGSQIAPRVE